VNELTASQSASVFDSIRSLWNLIRHELLFIFWALAEVALITPLVLDFTPWAKFWSPALVTVWLLLLMLIPFNLSRLANILKIPVDKQRIILAVALVITLLLAWRSLLYQPNSLIDLDWLGEFAGHLNEPGNPFWSRDLAIFIIVLLMWWRGISLVGRRVDINNVGLRLRISILLLLFFVAGLAGTQLAWPVTPFILLFYFSSLTAITLTRIEQLELEKSGQSFPISVRWFLVVIGGAGLVVFITGIITGFVSSESVIDVLGSFRPLWLATQFLAISVLITVSVLSTPLMILLGWLLEFLARSIGSMIGSGLEDIEINLPSPIETLPPEQFTETQQIAFQAPRQLLWLLIMLFFVLLVTLALGRLIHTVRQAAPSETESISPFSGRAKRDGLGVGQRLLDRFGLLRRWRTAASIRHIYRQMCTLAAENGYPRLESETPNEYLVSLAELWPENTDDTIIITEAYNHVHYGEIPETLEEIQRIQNAWNRLEETTPTTIES